MESFLLIYIGEQFDTWSPKTFLKIKNMPTNWEYHFCVEPTFRAKLRKFVKENETVATLDEPKKIHRRPTPPIFAHHPSPPKAPRFTALNADYWIFLRGIYRGRPPPGGPLRGRTADKSAAPSRRPFSPSLGPLHLDLLFFGRVIDCEHLSRLRILSRDNRTR